MNLTDRYINLMAVKCIGELPKKISKNLISFSSNKYKGRYSIVIKLRFNQESIALIDQAKRINPFVACGHVKQITIEDDTWEYRIDAPIFSDGIETGDMWVGQNVVLKILCKSITKKRKKKPQEPKNFGVLYFIDEMGEQQELGTISDVHPTFDRADMYFSPPQH